MRRNNNQSQAPNPALLRRALVTVNTSYVVTVIDRILTKPLFWLWFISQGK